MSGSLVFSVALVVVAAAWMVDRRRHAALLEQARAREAALAREVSELRDARAELGEMHLRLTSLARLVLPPDQVPPALASTCFEKTNRALLEQRRRLEHLETALQSARRRLRQRTRHLEALQQEVNRLRGERGRPDRDLRRHLAELQAERDLLRQRVDELAEMLRNRPPQDAAASLKAARETIDDLRVQLRAAQSALARSTPSPEIVETLKAGDQRR